MLLKQTVQAKFMDEPHIFTQIFDAFANIFLKQLDFTYSSYRFLHPLNSKPVKFHRNIFMYFQEKAK